jgi:hypothetical protein
VDIFSALAGILANPATPINGHAPQDLIISPAFVRGNLTDATLDDQLQNVIPFDLLSHIQIINNTQVQVGAGTSPGTGVNSPLTITLGGRRRQITAPLVATASGAVGPRYLILDATATGVKTFTTYNSGAMPGGSTAPALSQYQYLAGTYWWDGAVLRSTTVDTSMVASLTSDNVKLIVASAQGTAINTAITGDNAIHQNAAVPTTSFWLVKPATIVIINTFAWAAVAAGGHTAYAILDGGAVTANAILVAGYTAPSGQDARSNITVLSLGTGLHTITQQVYAPTGNNITPNGAGCAVHVLIFM